MRGKPEDGSTRFRRVREFAAKPRARDFQSSGALLAEGPAYERPAAKKPVHVREVYADVLLGGGSRLPDAAGPGRKKSASAVRRAMAQNIRSVSTSVRTASAL
jgi:hypothetical protein